MSETRRMSEGKPGLVIARRVGEKISVEHGFLMIEVTEIKRGQVKLRFIGDVSVWRAEIEEKNRNERSSRVSVPEVPNSNSNVGR